jgi:hypothetical protein|tara:strand:+ start:17755 stop:17868 length:114 start_codon:yes stop_codon:yes gene_type:complete
MNKRQLKAIARRKRVVKKLATKRLKVRSIAKSKWEAA